MEIDSVNYLKFLFALLFVLGLIGGFALVAKRLGVGTRGPTNRLKAGRLTIVENLQLDAKRRAILIKRDETEHLIVVGGLNDLVVESSIKSASIVKKSQTPSKSNYSLTDKIKQHIENKTE